MLTDLIYSIEVCHGLKIDKVVLWLLNLSSVYSVSVLCPYCSSSFCLLCGLLNVCPDHLHAFHSPLYMFYRFSVYLRIFFYLLNLHIIRATLPCIFIPLQACNWNSVLLSKFWSSLPSQRYQFFKMVESQKSSLYATALCYRPSEYPQTPHNAFQYPAKSTSPFPSPRYHFPSHSRPSSSPPFAAFARLP